MNKNLITKLEKIEDTNTAICRALYNLLNSQRVSRNELERIYKMSETQAINLCNLIDEVTI